MTQKQQLKVNQPFSMHIEIEVSGKTQADGEIYVLTPPIIKDQLEYVFERLNQKVEPGSMKVSFKVEIDPMTQTTTRKKEG